MTAAYLESMVETWKAEGLPDYEMSKNTRTHTSTSTERP